MSRAANALGWAFAALLAIGPVLFEWVGEGTGLKASVIAMSAEGRGLWSWLASLLVNPLFLVALSSIGGGVVGYRLRGIIQQSSDVGPSKADIEAQRAKDAIREADRVAVAANRLGGEMAFVNHFVTPRGFPSPFSINEIAQLRVLHDNAVELGVPIPEFDQFASGYSRKFCSQYLEMVGHILQNGRLERAIKTAEEMLPNWPRRT